MVIAEWFAHLSREVSVRNLHGNKVAVRGVNYSGSNEATSGACAVG